MCGKWQPFACTEGCVANNFNFDDYYSIAGHGGYGSFTSNTDFNSMANRAKNSGKSAILLIACGQGPENAESGTNSVQYIANQSGLPVIYNTGYVNPIWKMPNGLPLSFGNWNIAFPQSQMGK
jgi:hypothetical protein